MKIGSGAEDIYKPIWFAYDFIESFLLPVYTCNSTVNTENLHPVLLFLINEM